jgi:hypothetical protein
MEWEVLMHDVKLELLNTFLIKGADIYYGHKDKVYLINKQLIVDIFRMCAKRYVEEPKGQVSKSLAIHALQSYRLASPKFFTNQWNAKSLGSTILC